jgi:AraC-like DNA-binding protein
MRRENNDLNQDTSTIRMFSTNCLNGTRGDFDKAENRHRVPSRFHTELESPKQSHRIRAIRRAAVLREIEQRSSDPELSAAAIAARLGITPRYVHLMLKDTGRTFSHHVLEKRLDRAATLLRDPAWHHRKIADIAAEAGFSDLSHFSRAFRRAYGTTPSAARETARQGSK